MGFEVEIKYRLTDRQELLRRLGERGAIQRAEIDQEDTYLSHPARDFAVTNEAFRIRRTGSENRVTYKGPRHDGPTKTREEVEIRFDDGAEAYRQLLHLFEKLGFRPIATIHKRRTLFHLNAAGREIEVAHDHAEGLGEFAEIETLAAAQADLLGAQAAVLQAAAELGLTEVEPRSYLRMALEARFAAREGRVFGLRGLASNIQTGDDPRSQNG
jgi:adenylate cyclase class 2